MDQGTEIPAPKSEVTVWDQNVPTAVINYLTPAVSNRVKEARESRPDLFILDEQDLYKKLRSEGRTPTPTDNRIRLQFWHEYEKAMLAGKNMVMSDVIAGVTSKDYFYDSYLIKDFKVAWLMVPPATYMTKAREAVEYGIEQLRDILSEPHTTPKGLDHKLLNMKIKIVEMLDERVRGAVAQKVQIESKTQTIAVTAHANAKDVQALAAQMTTEELIQKIKQLEQPSNAIEVECKKIGD